MTYNELPDYPDADVLLYCAACGSEYSAYGSDYFMSEGTDVIECGECGEPLDLVRKQTRLIPITPAEAEG